MAALTAMAISTGSAASNASLYDLRTEFLTNPLGIDEEKPRFSWKMQDDREGALQQAWQLQVATTTESLVSGSPDVWDSGKNDTSASVGIVYDGPAIKPRTTYVWHVKAWDKEGQETAYSTPAIWETGLMERNNWKGKWIAGHVEEETAETAFDDVTWIWYPEGNPAKEAPKGRRFFRYHFELPDKDVTRADAWALVDNSCIVYINGERAHTADGFGSVAATSVTEFFKPGANTVQIAAGNTGENPAGLAWCADLTFADGTTKRISTDISWRTSKEPGKDWPEDGFGKGDWIGVQDLGEIGMEPWGTPKSAVPGGPATIHRKQFDAESAPESARLYITSLGSYRAEINGQRVGDAVLTPDWTDFRDRAMYQTYDVTPLLRSGTNALGVTLGDGWYASGLGWQLERYTQGEPPTRLLAQLHMRYPDGREEVITSDNTWKTTESAIRRSEIYYGEIYDARLEAEGWTTANFDDSAWQASLEPETTSTIELNSQASPPIRATQELKPVAIDQPTTDTYVVDMGQNMVGWARLKVSGNAGDKVRMRFAEILNDDGTIYTENLRKAEATDTYILKGDGEEVYEPHFTYHGFRYIEVTGYPGGAPPKEAITGIVFHTDAPMIGEFESSNDMVNKVVENTMWGLRGNMMSIPTDCPQRDERLGWTGDAQAIWKTASYNMDVAAFTEKFTRDMIDAQSEAGGFPNVAPRVVVHTEGAPAWGDAGIILPYDTWRMFGNVRLLEQAWPAMEKWMAYIQEENTNYLWLKRRSNDFGDWVPADSETDKDMIATAYWAQDARMMAEMAAGLGKQDKVAEYLELYNKIRKAFQEKFIKPDGKIANGSQTCYVLALNANLVQPELVDEAVKHLVADIKSRKNHLSTGFLGTSYLMPVLTEHGQNDVAMTLLLNKTYPSWGYMVEKGATTIWERWNSDTGDPAMNSFNHYCYGAVTDWLYGYLAGIRPVSPGFQEILIEPHPDQRMQSAKAEYDSTYGPITSDWKYNGDTLALHVAIPANTTAKISLPTDDASKVTLGGKSLADANYKTTTENGRTIINTGSGKFAFEVKK